MVKKIILHIGARKSGSTTIQKTLANNNDILHGYGCHYLESARMPKGSGDGHYAHHRAARPLEKGEYWNQIIKEVQKNKYKKYIISSEILYSLSRNEIQAIKKYIGTSGVQKTDVIMIKRNPIDFIVSEYKQQIKITNEYRRLVDFAKANIEKCRHDAALERWVSVLNIDRSVVLNLDDFRGGIVSSVRFVSYWMFRTTYSRRVG